jgi:TRAP-type mannitol/chloroaromatic compound transport system permease large subunit
MAGLMALGLFLGIGLALMAGYPVAFTLAGAALSIRFSSKPSPTGSTAS